MVMDKNYLKALVEKMDLLAGVPKEEMEWLCGQTHKINLQKDEYFLRAGDVPKYISINNYGLLRLFYLDENGVEITKHFCMENSMAFSYTAFINQEESKIFIQAVEKTELTVFDYQIYLKLKERHSCWQAVSQNLTMMLFILKEKREAELLLKDAEERYRQFVIDYPDLESRLTGYHIASYLRIKPESLSRIRKKIKNKYEF